MQIEPYLFFEGRCEEAIKFYQRTVDAQVLMMMRYSESPDPPPPGMIPPGSEKKVMHASLRIGDSKVMMSDGGCSGKTNFGGVSLSLSVTNADEARRRFEALSEGGQVTMPLGETFFASSFGMLTDRFGLGWMVIVEK